jgi:hypothetical protein
VEQLGFNLMGDLYFVAGLDGFRAVESSTLLSRSVELDKARFSPLYRPRTRHSLSVSDFEKKQNKLSLFRKTYFQQWAFLKAIKVFKS